MSYYDLATQLKNAGFPQEGRGKFSWDVPETPDELV